MVGLAPPCSSRPVPVDWIRRENPFSDRKRGAVSGWIRGKYVRKERRGFLYLGLVAGLNEGVNQAC